MSKSLWKNMIVNRPLLCPNAGGSAKMGTQNADFCIFTRNAYCVALGSIVAHSVCLQDNISSPEEYMGCYQPFWGVRRYDTWVYIVLYIYMVYAHAWMYLIWNYTWYITFGYICFAHKYTQVMYNTILQYYVKKCVHKMIGVLVSSGDCSLIGIGILR